VVHAEYSRADQAAQMLWDWVNQHGLNGPADVKPFVVYDAGVLPMESIRPDGSASATGAARNAPDTLMGIFIHEVSIRSRCGEG